MTLQIPPLSQQRNELSEVRSKASDAGHPVQIRPTCFQNSFELKTRTQETKPFPRREMWMVMFLQKQTLRWYGFWREKCMLSHASPRCTWPGPHQSCLPPLLSLLLQWLSLCWSSNPISQMKELAKPPWSPAKKAKQSAFPGLHRRYHSMCQLASAASFAQPCTRCGARNDDRAAPNPSCNAHLGVGHFDRSLPPTPRDSKFSVRNKYKESKRIVNL